MDDVKLKKRSTGWFLGRCLGGVLLAWLMILPVVQVKAGTEAADPQRRIEVQLRGANEFGGVQLFQFLLGRAAAVRSAEPVGLHVEPDTPVSCRASWRVTTSGEDAVTVAQQLVAIIKQLDPDAQNEVLYESPFVVTVGDLALIKRAEPVIINDNSVYFSIGVQTGVIDQPSDSASSLSTNRWQLLPGAGFD